jgi:hypothetical protein
MKTGLLREWISERWLGIDKFTELEQEIADNLNLARQCADASKKSSPHPADVEFADKATRTAIELAQQYTELAMRHDTSKLATLAKVVATRNANIQQESKPKLIVGKLLLDFLDANDRLPESKTELLDSASDVCNAEIADQKLAPNTLLSRGLEFYELQDRIQDKRGRKS